MKLRSKKVLGAVSFASALLLCFTLVGCGGDKGAATTTNQGGKKVLTIGASPSPHGDILKVVQKKLEGSDVEIKIQEYTDYVTPNKALADGSIDANFFQHKPYLDDYNAKNGTKLVPVANVHFEALSIYPGKSKDLNAIKDGAKFAIPNDTTNEARALQLLQAQGLIKLKEGVGLEATPKDIVENPHNLQFLEVEAAIVPTTLKDADFGVVNGNFALSSGMDTSQVLAHESKDSEAAQKYANILVVREDQKDDPAIQEVVKAITSQEVKDYINATYSGAVIPVF